MRQSKLIMGCLIILLLLLVVSGFIVYQNYINPMASLAEVNTYINVAKNFLFLFASIFGLIFALWRTYVAEDQVEISRHSYRYDRYQNSANSLASNKMSVRQAGIYSLTELAIEDPQKFYLVVQDLLCGFIRERSEEQREIAKHAPIEPNCAIKTEWPPRQGDLQDALNAFSKIRFRAKLAKKLELSSGVKPNLTGLFAPRYELISLDFSNCQLDGMVLADCFCDSSNFSNSSLNGATIPRSIFQNCSFDDAVGTAIYANWGQYIKCSFQHCHFTMSQFENCLDIDSAHIDEGLLLLDPTEPRPQVSFPTYTDMHAYEHALQQAQYCQSAT